MQQIQQDKRREVPAGPPSSSSEGQQPVPPLIATANSNGHSTTTTPLSKKARRKASMLKWREEQLRKEKQILDQGPSSASSSDFSVEGEEEDFYRLKNNERSKYPWNRPKSGFCPRARWTTSETRLNERWRAARFGAPPSSINDADKKPFVVLDGPPYANGPIHLGHVLNKVLKDAICKYKRMSGYDVRYIVGWDCHGLPIEKLLSLENESPNSNSNSNEGEDLEDTLKLLRSCQEHASKWVNKQKQSFTKLGILADWEGAYRTDDASYQAAVVRAFGRFVEGGYIEHHLRPVPWCTSCRTVLAHAEISHLTLSDPSCYVFFPCNNSNDPSSLLELFGASDPLPPPSPQQQQPAEKEKEVRVGFLVWTTSPWSLPFNRGVALHPSLEYCMLSLVSEDEAMIMKVVVAVDCVASLRKALISPSSSSSSSPQDGGEIRWKGVERIGRTVKASLLCEGIGTLGHPIVEGLSVPIVLHGKVSSKIGTAILHVAPGCCEEDYLLGKEQDLDISCTIGEDGRFTEEINIEGLKGLSVEEANDWVLRDLKAHNNLVLRAGMVEHSSPHCWRCSTPLLFRMTKQWFINLDRNNLFDRAQQEIKNPTTTFYPPKSKNPFLSTLSCRPHEWCISRQRKWGVPIPAILCGGCGQGYTSMSLCSKVADLLEHLLPTTTTTEGGGGRRGLEFYWQHVLSCPSFSELCKRFPTFLREDFVCSHCGHCALDEDECGDNLRRRSRMERDIFDIWFESGIASYALHQNGSHSSSSSSSSSSRPFDMLCEGQDQHRGWYQALLFCSLVLEGQLPAASYLTHSFVVGQDRKKLSKSSLPQQQQQPQQPQQRQGLPTHIQFHETVVGRKPDDFCGDMLRLWACSSKYSANVIMADDLYRSLRKKYMLLRHTTWFILANLHDYSPPPSSLRTSEKEEQGSNQTLRMEEEEDLFPYDKFTLSVLHRLATKVHVAYEGYDFATVCSLLFDYIQKDLRPLYLIHAKTRLYFEKADSPLRRSAQFTLWRIATVLAQLWAPILSFYSEQVQDELLLLVGSSSTTTTTATNTSIHMQRFESTMDPLQTKKDRCRWISLEKLRKLVAVEVEAKRKDNLFSRNEYARVSIELVLLPPSSPSSSERGKAKIVDKKKKKEDDDDDDCNNIKSFLEEEFADEKERIAFLCSYFNVSQCTLSYSSPSSSPSLERGNGDEGLCSMSSSSSSFDTSLPAQSASSVPPSSSAVRQNGGTHDRKKTKNTINNNKKKGRMDATVKTPKQKNIAAASGGTALKDRLKVTLEHATGRLCCRCDFFFIIIEQQSKDEGDVVASDKNSLLDETEKEERHHHHDVVVGLCSHCTQQLQ